MKIATCQYQLEPLANWDAYEKRICTLVHEAQKKGSQFLLLPEYAGIEIVDYHKSDVELFSAIQDFIPQYRDLFQNLSKKYQIYIQPGTIVERSESSKKKYYNRAYLFHPSGKIEYQDKLKLTEYEKNSQLIQEGILQKVFDTDFGKIGIAVCYDSEFPEIIRKLTFSGVWLVLVPSYVTSLHGYYRVSISCRARAIENQCYVANSFMVGAVRTSYPFEETYGSAEICSPVDKGFPENGVLVKGKMNCPNEIICTEISKEKLDFIRKNGDVLNFSDSLLL